MKRFLTVIAVLLVIVLLLGVGLQMFLTKSLTTALNEGVFPAIKSRYGLVLSIKNASVNLFKGRAELDGFAVLNLKGYEEPCFLAFDHCLIDVEMMSLLKRNPVVIKLAEVKGATLVIERNKKRLFNVQELVNALKPAEPTGTPAETPATEQPATPQQTPAAQTTPSTETAFAESAKPVPVHIRRIAVDADVKYADTKRKEKYDLKLSLTGSDLFTVPTEGQPDSLLVLRGALIDDKEYFVTDLNAIVKPLTDLEHPTFNATGSILDIDKKFLGDLLNKKKMESTAFSIKPSITCKQGQLKGSRIDLVLNNLKIYGAEIGETTLKLPLNGTLQDPVLDLTGALESLFSEQSGKIGKAIGLRQLRKEMETNTNRVGKLSGSPALQQLIEQVAQGPESTNAAVTNLPIEEAASNALIEQLNKGVKELEDNKEVKESLKNLGNSLFGK